MGFFSGLDTESYDRQYSDRDLVRRIIQYFKPYSKGLLVVAFFLALIAVSGAAVPVLVSRAVNALDQQIENSQIWILSAAVLVSGVFSWGGNWVRRRLLARITQDVIMDIRVQAFRAAASHDLSFYDEFSSGRIVSRITSDTREFGQVVILVTDLVTQLVQAGLVAFVLFNAEPQLMLWLVITLPLIFLFAIGFRRLARKVTRRGMRAMGNVNAAIKETVSGISVAKNFRQEGSIFGEFDDANQSSFRVNLQRGVVLSLLFPSLNTLQGFATAILLYVGGMQAAAGVVSIGSWYLFMQSLDRFWFPVLNLSSFWTQLQSGLSASERSFALIDAEHKVVQVNQNPVPQLSGEILFDKVDFSYTEQESVLHQFDLHIKPGENIALVGHTGAGKSSIAKLVARFYEFQSGNLLVDGMDIRSFNLIDFRQQLGIVSQIPFLFSGTVVENIRYARPDVSDEEILTLARRIGDGEWLNTLPHGLETEVGERGGRLSMGQRQLVSLLRVLVQRPAIFILDEATASIDPFTEWQIQQGLDLILRDTTSILIAHRLSTVRAADRIIVLDNGQIIEEGDHDGLLSLGGHYAGLYNTYFRHQSLAYVEQSVEFSELE
ncbi:MAG TPA: ABC transporter ATP-binding protein [Anaerolineales bacterium]|jgi:ATP-binding cassette subfamily B protein|nr:ABC transporter ATP-binding protein [Anaerolineales bacterium]